MLLTLERPPSSVFVLPSSLSPSENFQEPPLRQNRKGRRKLKEAGARTLTLTYAPSFSVAMMKASVKARYETDKSSASASLSVNAGDVKLRATMTDATVVNGPSLNGLSLSLDKPGSFLINYDVPKKDVRFQFMNTIRISDKPLNLTYSHSRGDNRTALDGTLVVDPANKVSTSYAFGSGNCKVKYTYVHGGTRTFEPCYDFSKNSWDFAVSQRFYGDDVVRASYQTSSNLLGVEWARNSKATGSFKISASVNLAEELMKLPKFSAESTWDIEM